MPMLNEFINLLGRIFILLSVFIVFKFIHSESLILIGFIYSSIPVVVMIVFSFVLFSSRFKIVTPRISKIDFKLSNVILSLGGKFFIIQIAVLVLFSTDNIIISQLFSPGEVTPYQIAGRYFGMITTLFVIIASPFWSASTEAFMKNEYNWIKKSFKSLLLIAILFIFIIIIMLSFSSYVYKLWIGDTVTIPFSVSLGWALFVTINLFGIIITQFINGSGKIRISIYMAITNAIINIPLSIFFAKYLNLGLLGVILATTVCIAISITVRLIQLKMIINSNDVGIWSK